MQVEVLEQHKWLQQFVGRWTYDMSCVMTPGQEPEVGQGAETLDMLGEIWLVSEGGSGQGEAAWKSILTLGYDPQQQRFVGTFIASMMTHLWVYSGSLDASGRVLTLDTEGPNMTDGSMTKYQDIHTLVGPDERTLTSRAMDAQGNWSEFMTAVYKRVG